MTSTRHKNPNLDLKVTLDAVFRRNVLIRPGALAVADPPNRSEFTGTPARRLNYAEADAAVTKLARQLKSLGIADRAIVAIQLPSTVESVLTMLAVIRAGMVAAPIPYLWRRSDIVMALRDINAGALITMTQVGGDSHAEIACEAAAELFTLGFPCAFGAVVPDGVTRLDLDAHTPPGEREFLPAHEADSADEVAIATFDAARHGPFLVGRNHSQWLAAGLAVLLEARIATGDTIVSTLSMATLAGLAGGFVPWLLSGGPLQLVHGLSRQFSIAEPDSAHIIAPATTLNSLVDGSNEKFSSAVAIHRNPDSLGIDLSRLNCGAIVDLQVFGEIGITALRRIAKVMPSPIPLGSITAPTETDSAPTVIETKRLPDGTLALRGAMVPDKVFPPNIRVDAPQPEFDVDGFVRTNLKCHSVGGNSLAIESGVDGVISVGGMRYGVDDLKTRVASASSNAKISTARNTLLGTRLTIKSADPSETIKVLDEAGHSSLIIEGVRERPALRRAAS